MATNPTDPRAKIAQLYAAQEAEQARIEQARSKLVDIIERKYRTEKERDAHMTKTDLAQLLGIDPKKAAYCSTDACESLREAGYTLPGDLQWPIIPSNYRFNQQAPNLPLEKMTTNDFGEIPVIPGDILQWISTAPPLQGSREYRRRPYHMTLAGRDGYEYYSPGGRDEYERDKIIPEDVHDYRYNVWRYVGELPKINKELEQAIANAKLGPKEAPVAPLPTLQPKPMQQQYGYKPVFAPKFQSDRVPKYQIGTLSPPEGLEDIPGEWLPQMTVVAPRDEKGRQTLEYLNKPERSLDPNQSGFIDKNTPEAFEQNNNLLRLWEYSGYPQIAPHNPDRSDRAYFRPIQNTVYVTNQPTSERGDQFNKEYLPLRDEYNRLTELIQNPNVSREERQKAMQSRNLVESQWNDLYAKYPETEYVTNTDDILAELPHARQLKEKGPVRLLASAIPDFIRAPYITEEQYQKQYSTPGTIEHEAHRIKEPEFRNYYSGPSIGPTVKLDLGGEERSVPEQKKKGGVPKYQTGTQPGRALTEQERRDWQNSLVDWVRREYGGDFQAAADDLKQNPWKSPYANQAIDVLDWAQTVGSGKTTPAPDEYGLLQTVSNILDLPFGIVAGGGVGYLDDVVRAASRLPKNNAPAVTANMAERVLPEINATTGTINLARQTPKVKPAVRKAFESIEDPNFDILKIYSGSKEIPKRITLKGKSGTWAANRSGDGTYYFNASMSNPLESGKAMMRLNELLPPKPEILEKSSYSLDSWLNHIKLGQRPHWSSEFQGYIPLNHSAIHNRSLADFVKEPTTGISVFSNRADAEGALKIVNEQIKKQGIPENAIITEQGDFFRIEIPNYKLTRDYQFGGVNVPKQQMGTLPTPAQLDSASQVTANELDTALNESYGTMTERRRQELKDYYDNTLIPYYINEGLGVQEAKDEANKYLYSSYPETFFELFPEAQTAQELGPLQSLYGPILDKYMPSTEMGTGLDYYGFSESYLTPTGMIKLPFDVLDAAKRTRGESGDPLEQDLVSLYTMGKTGYGTLRPTVTPEGTKAFGLAPELEPELEKDALSALMREDPEAPETWRQNPFNPYQYFIKSEFVPFGDYRLVYDTRDNTYSYRDRYDLDQVPMVDRVFQPYDIYGKFKAQQLILPQVTVTAPRKKSKRK